MEAAGAFFGSEPSPGKTSGSSGGGSASTSGARLAAWVTDCDRFARGQACQPWGGGDQHLPPMTSVNPSSPSSFSFERRELSRSEVCQIFILSLKSKFNKYPSFSFSVFPLPTETTTNEGGNNCHGCVRKGNSIALIKSLSDALSDLVRAIKPIAVRSCLS